MTNIVLHNFEDKFEFLETSLKSAVFVSIDTEFSGLRSTRTSRPSLFDTNKTRYEKMKSHIKNYVIIQFGLSAFHYDETTNSYSADVFNVYLFPRSFSTSDVSFKFQPTSVQFLCRYNFDFNKMAYEGVSYVTMQKEVQLKADLESGFLLHKLLCCCEVDIQDQLKTICSCVGKWLVTAKQGEKLIVNCPDNIQLLVHHSLRVSFPTLWTEKLPVQLGENDRKCKVQKVAVTKVSAQMRVELESAPGGKWYENETLEHMLGFSRVFSVLSNLSVPIIGHNVLLDFMMSFKQFVAPLPAKYEEFKTKLHQAFSKIYDTKVLSLDIKKNIRHDDLWDSSLQGVYTFLQSQRCAALFPGQPLIQTADYNMCPKTEGTKEEASFSRVDDTLAESGDESGIKEISPVETHDKSHFHEAGWDSFCSGFVFLRLAYIQAYTEQQKRLDAVNPQDNPPFTWARLLQAVEEHENKIHITMGQISHMCLGGDDVETHRPPLLHIQSRTFAALNIPAVQNMLARCGSVDVKSYARCKALVAAPNVGCVRDILLTFKNHPSIKVELYSVYRHSCVVRSLLWMGAAACSIAGCALLTSMWRK